MMSGNIKPSDYQVAPSYPKLTLFSQAPSQNALLQQIKNDVGSFFETAHP